jgi:two-component system response regulator RegA
MQTRSRKIIVVDDDIQVIREASKLFSGLFRVLGTANPMHAVALAEREENVRVIISEEVLVSGSGLDLLETVRTLRPHIRRVMLTTYADLASIVIGLHSGAIEALVQKPAQSAELLSAIWPETAGKMAQLLRAAG